MAALDGQPADQSNINVAATSVAVEVNLSRVRASALAIRQRIGVPLLAVVKADAYGLGAQQVAQTIADLVDGFCVFKPAEAHAAALWKTAAKPILSLTTGPDDSPDDFLAAHIRPCVWNADQANRLARAHPVLCVDCGMQRFACPPEKIESVLAAAKFTEAFTHAIRLEQVNEFVKMVGSRGLKLHAAGSSLMDEPSARLDAVRPGIALYRGAVRVTTPLVDVRDSHGPAGYSGFSATRFSVIQCGYAQGLRPGPCLVNGQRRRLLEVGMQSTFVEAGPADHPGDPVTLLGHGLTERDIAAAWNVNEHEALLRMCGLGQRVYVPAG